MNYRVKTGLNIALWSCLIVYTIFAVRYCDDQQTKIICKGLKIEVKDSSELKFITPFIVKNILVNAEIKIKGELLSKINTLEIEREISSRGYVKRVNAYTSIDGFVNIEIEQRRPILRIQSETGYNIYISDDNYVLPIQSYFHLDVPIITGVVTLPFSKNFIGALPYNDRIKKKYAENYKFLYNLINFVRFLENEPFWEAQVVQINVVEGTNIEIIPRVGNYVIRMGELDGYLKKLDKLLTFYKKGLIYEGWQKYRYINIEYENQVVCAE